MAIKEYLKNRINESWYVNAKIDYNINGHFDDVTTCGEHLIIEWTEEETKLALEIAYYADYTHEQLYRIWMEVDEESTIKLS